MKCSLCPRKCGIDREKSKGYCGCDDKIRVARVSAVPEEAELYSSPVAR